MAGEVADGGRVWVPEPPEHDGEPLPDVWPRVLETVHPSEQLRVRLRPLLLVQPVVGDLQIETFGVQLPDHLPRVVRGLVVDVHLAPRCLIGVHLGTLR